MGCSGLSALGVERPCAEVGNVLFKALLVDDRLHFLIGDDVDLGDFVRGAEAVEEGDEGNARTEGRKVRDEGEVHDFLHRAGGDHGKARLAACHDVGMVAEDVQRVCGERARRNVHDHRQKFARDLVHIGDHEKEPLRSGVSGRQRACGE